jgi:hypothetical protein
MQNAAGPAFLADCPTRLAVEIIADIDPIEVLTNWARDYGGAIVDFQEAAEAATTERSP